VSYTERIWLQGPRAQVDRKLYKRHMQVIMSRYPELDIRAGSVFNLVFGHSHAALEDGKRWGKVVGVKLGEYDCRPFLNT
jgi:tRNA uridine 5-carboxymethylaminomethyl modification enzyme